MDKRKYSIDFSIKAAWLAISKMYNAQGADRGLTHSTGFVLLNIDKEHGSPATKIAPHMGMEARSLTRMLKSMEEKGYIVRTSDPNDGRKTIIKLTALGQEKREIARQTVKAFNNKLKESIPEEHLKIFFDIMDVVTQYAENETVFAADDHKI